MPKIRKKDADRKRMLRDWFRSNEGQKALKEVSKDDVMTDPYGRPINVMLPEAEVSTLGNKDRDLAKDALDFLGGAAFETARAAPILGDAIDIAEVLGAYVTGKDLYGDEVNPNAQFGLTAAGLLIPNILERPVKYLLSKGAKNVDDIKRILRENPNAPELQPLDDLQNKAREFQSHVYRNRGLDKVHDNVIRSKGLSTYGDNIEMEKVASNYLMERNPDLLMEFTPEKFDAGMYDEAMRDFADKYLTSFRSVAASEDNARKFLTDAVGTGSGGRNLGPGLYQSVGEAQIHGSNTGSYGGYLGAIRVAPEVGGSFDDATRILKDLQAKEYQGIIDLDNFKTEGMTVHKAQEHLHNMRMLPGMVTKPEIRVVRSGEGVKLLDMASDVDAKKDILSKYDSDYFGASYNPYDDRGVKGRYGDNLNPNYFSRVKGLGFSNIR